MLYRKRNYMKHLVLWNRLRKVQTNKIVSSTYIWLIIVPVAVKVMSKLENEITFTINSLPHTIDLLLPFSWQAFFMSALFFELGNILFIISSPRIIKEYKDYGDFLQIGGDDTDLTEYKDEFLKSKETDLSRLKRLMGAEEETESLLERNESTRKKFWEVYEYYNDSLSYLRYFIACIYFIGFMFFMYVAAKNITWVFGQITIF